MSGCDWQKKRFSVVMMADQPFDNSKPCALCVNNKYQGSDKHIDKSLEVRCDSCQNKEFFKLKEKEA